MAVPLALLVATWLAGVLLGLYIDLDPLPLVLLLLAVLPLGLLLRTVGRSAWPAVLVGIALLALLRVEATDTPPAPLVTRDGQVVTLRGRIVSDPEATARKAKFVLAVASIDRGDGWQPLRSHRDRSLVYADPPASLVPTGEAPYFRYGDNLLLRGVLKEPEPFGGFDYPAYLANQGIHGILWSRQAELVSREGGIRWRGWMFELRGRLAASLENALPPSQSALAEALLLGVRGRLPPEVVVNFRNTGTSHLLAISGLNVSILLVPAVAAAGWWLGRRRQIYLLLPLASIWFYALVSGLSVSVVRAAIMASVYLAALAVGRPRSVLPALAFSAAVMAAIDPGSLRQVSLQLSFTAVAGIALAVPYQARIREAVTRGSGVSGLWWPAVGGWSRFLASWVLIALVVSAAATLATLPLVAFNFHMIPLFGIFATMLALPMLPFMLLGSLAAAVAGLIAPSLGQFFGWLAWPPLSYLLGLVSLTPGTTVSGAWVGPPLVWAWYILLGGVLILPGGVSYLKGLSSRLAARLWHPALRSLGALQPTSATLSFLGLLLILTVAAILLWVQVFRGPDGKLHVYFFDVGQGDSALIVTPGGLQVLVDGGPEAESATRALAGPLALWDRSLDMVVLTHLDADHSRGLLKVLDRYQVAAVVMGRAESRPMGVPDAASGLYPQWVTALERRQFQVIPMAAGYRIMLEPEVALEVLNPPPIPFRGSPSDDNNNGVVLRLVYGDVRFLLAADIEALAEEHLVGRIPDLESEVLKVAHHGSKTSTTAEFLQRVSPSYAVISAGAENRYGHPHPQVMARLREQPGLAGIYQTAQQGSIEFISDGHHLWVKTQR